MGDTFNESKKRERSTGGDKESMRKKKGNVGQVGPAEVINLLEDEEVGVAPEVAGEGTQPAVPARGSDTGAHQRTYAGWGQPALAPATHQPHRHGWGEAYFAPTTHAHGWGDIQPVDNDEQQPLGLEPVPREQAERKETPAVNNWGHPGEKSADWETYWASTSGANPGWNANWGAPDWSQTNGGANPGWDADWGAPDWSQTNSGANPGTDANWETPDWSQTRGGRGSAAGGPSAATENDGYVTFDGEPVVVERRSEVDFWCDHIRSQGVTVLGFDTEWKPDRRKGQSNPIALMQLCFKDPTLDGGHRVVLFHTIKTGVTKKLKKLLEDEEIIKAGVDFRCDRKKLDYHFGVMLDGAVDLSAEYVDIVLGGHGNQVGMKTLVNQVLGLEMKKPKRLQMVNWERSLTYDAIQYGALDAYVCMRLYEELIGCGEGE